MLTEGVRGVNLKGYDDILEVELKAEFLPEEGIWINAHVQPEKVYLTLIIFYLYDCRGLII